MWNEWLYIFLHTEYSYSNAVYVFVSFPKCIQSTWLSIYTVLFINFVNYKKKVHSTCSPNDKVYQLLAHGLWFSPGTRASSDTKTGRIHVRAFGRSFSKVSTRFFKKCYVPFFLVMQLLDILVKFKVEVFYLFFNWRAEFRPAWSSASISSGCWYSLQI
jgi:hypothetical protein